MKQKVDLAIVGATGAVGETMLKVLAERDFAYGEVFPLASRRSAGKTLSFAGRTLDVQDLAAFDFSNVQVALFSASAEISAHYAPRAVEAGCVVIDNTSQYRNEADIPLVVPEVNGEAIALYRQRGIIANPNCSTIQMVTALKPLHDCFQVLRVNVMTCQAVSGAGRSAIMEMENESHAVLAGEQYERHVFAKQIAFNVLPHIGDFEKNGYTREEMKIVWETRKILGEPDLLVNPTAVRVPVSYGHSMAVHLEFASEPDIAQARAALAGASGVIVVDEVGGDRYPTAVTEAAGKDAVFVGRIRRDISNPKGLNLWVVADNLRKGAATNSIQIAECLRRDYLNS